MAEGDSPPGLYHTDAPVVSVWVGTFPTADAHRDYFATRPAADGESDTCRFWDDLGVGWTDPDDEECSGYVGDPVPVAELLGRSFSYLDSFRSALLSACGVAGVKTANLVLLLYGFEYTQARFISPYLTFVGAFPYRTDAEPGAAPDSAA